MQKITLLELQRHLQQTIKASALAPADQSPIYIKDQPPISVVDRLFIYQNAYWLRMEESLGDDFSRVKEIVGECSFTHVVKDYLHTLPSHFWSLAEVSMGFSDFVAQHPLGFEFPFLSDLAKFQWHEMLSFLAPDEIKYDFSQLSTLSTEQHQKLVLKLGASVFLFHSSFNVHDLSAHNVAKNDYYYITYKKNNEVIQKNIVEPQFKLLHKISLGHSIEALMSNSAKLQQADISDWFSYWVCENIITHAHF